jgi:hypothetical protein
MFREYLGFNFNVVAIMIARKFIENQPQGVLR